MPRLTWNINNGDERADAAIVFKIYRKHNFVAKHNGRTVVSELDLPPLNSLTFEPIRTAYDRIMEDD